VLPLLVETAGGIGTLADGLCTDLVDGLAAVRRSIQPQTSRACTVVQCSAVSNLSHAPKVRTLLSHNVLSHVMRQRLPSLDLTEQPEKEAAKRELTFGTNRLPVKKHASILHLMLEALKVFAR
jgi:hypothetical protein